MKDENVAIGEKLKGFIYEIYESCTNPKKSEKCICFEDPSDIPCRCRHMSAIREQLKFIHNEG